MNQQVKPDWDLTAKYLANEANENEQDRLHQWEMEDTENQHELGRLDDAWTLSGKERILFKIDENKAWDKVSSILKGKAKKSIDRKIPSIFSSRFARMAAGILLLAAVAAGLYMITGKLHSSGGLVAVSNNESNPLTISLSDGSFVSLNKGAHLEYPEKINQNSREVTLRGEAFFEVKPDPLKPFIVHTRSATIRVLGTSFNVSEYNYSQEVKVIVETGKVELQPAFLGSKKIILEKGNFGSYHMNNSAAIKGNNTDINYLSWKTRVLRFDDTPLQEVTAVLSKTYHSEIDLSSPELKKCRFTGTFSEESLDTVIKVLQTAFGLKIESKDKKTLLSGKGC